MTSRIAPEALRPELSGVSIVANGAFNPAILHPTWFADNEIIPRELADFVLKAGEKEAFLVSPQVTNFTADWLFVKVTQNQAVLSTVDQARDVDLRDFAKGLFTVLPETPVNAFGINADSHFRSPSESAWHAVGDRLAPKDFWEPLFEHDMWKTRSDGKVVGLRSMTVEIAQHDRPDFDGRVRIEFGPSTRIQRFGVYVGINVHFGLTKEGRQGRARDAARILSEQWEPTRSLALSLTTKLSGEIWPKY